MELRQLKYFMAACELQNFSEAARQHITSKAFLFWPQGIYRKKSALAFAACLQQEAKEGMKYRTSNS